MIVALYFLNAVLMIGLAIVLGVFLARRYQVPARLWWIGAATFVLSQVGHIPFNALFGNGAALPLPEGPWRVPLLALALGLSAGLFEEIARYLAYRFWIPTARTWRQAVMFGAGHGGIEAVIVGVLAALTPVNILLLTMVDPARLGLNPEQAAQAAAQIGSLLALPWYMTLLGAVERVFALIFHISAAVLVLQVFRRRNLLWLVAAILWHTALNATALIVVDRGGPLWAEAALAVLSLVGLGIIYAFRDPPAADEASAPPPEPLPQPVLSPLAPPPLSADKLNESKYQ